MQGHHRTDQEENLSGTYKEFFFFFFSLNSLALVVHGFQSVGEVYHVFSLLVS